MHVYDMNVSALASVFAVCEQQFITLSSYPVFFQLYAVDFVNVKPLSEFAALVEHFIYA